MKVTIMNFLIELLFLQRQIFLAIYFFYHVNFFKPLSMSFFVLVTSHGNSHHKIALKFDGLFSAS